MDDFENAFAEATAEVEANPDTGGDTELAPSAKVFLGDGEVVGEQDFDGESESTELDDPVDETGESKVSTETVDNETDNSSESFDWTAHKDKQVTIQVNGEDVTVPLGEMVNGYLRQSDYTRKTQEIAGSRKMVEAATQLKNALESDPSGTIAALAQSYGIEFGADETVDDEYTTDDPELKPILERQRAQDRKLAEQERQFQAQMQSQRERQVLEEVKAEVSAVKAEFEDFDPNVVLPIAMEKGLNVRDAYLLSVSQNSIVQRAADKAKSTKAAEVAQQAEAKRKASKIAGSTGLTASRQEPAKTFDSFEGMLTDAFGI